MTSIRKALPSDLPACARVLAAAFERYPWTRWSVPADGYAERLEALQRIYLRHALDHGLVLVDEDRLGVTALLAPEAPAPGAVQQQQIADLLGEGLERLVGAELPPRPAATWDLATLGVHPDSWGQGLASALLAEALCRLDDLDARIALETSDHRNVTLYSRHGFEVTATTPLPEGPTVHSMLREKVSARRV